MAYGLTLLLVTTIHLFHLFYSYHDLMVVKYGCKREKSREARWRSAEERKPMWEMERAVDIDLFLEAQIQWAKDSPHRLIILHEMFLYAESQGWKEAEWVVHWGYRQYMPQLDLRRAHPPSNWCILTLKENNYWTSTWRFTSYIGCLVLHQENQPFWKRYHPFSLALHWRKKTLPTSKDCPAPKTPICPSMYLPSENKKIQ